MKSPSDIPLGIKIDKINKLPQDDIESIIDAYIDYPFQEGERYLLSVLGTRDKIASYLKMSLRNTLDCGWLYSLGENREAYLAISSSDSKVPLSVLLKLPFRSSKAVGTKPLYNLFKLVKNMEPSLASTMKKEKRKYIHVEMLCVKKEYQGQGFMKKALEVAFKLADIEGVPCILETDEKNKASRYEHLGMEIAAIRHLNDEFVFYDMIYTPNKCENSK